MASFYWHDYETWGATPSIDRPSQFAGVRTDEDLNILGEPLVIYCKPPEDVLPQPEACLVTGITPQHARQHGLSEPEFIARIHAELIQPGTCTVGYNSLRFDDEITRYTLYRNFYDPYEREWRNGNSRWDIIDMMRMVHALRPEGIEWPKVDGITSFKLEGLTEANGISHASAHDAFSDVEATIALARLVKTKKPELYQYVLANKSKQAISKKIDIASKKPMLHISSRFPAARGCAGLVVPLAAHPSNGNAVIVYDLSVDPSPLEHLSAEELANRVFVSNDELPEGVERLPIKLVHLNKCPILLPTKMLDDKAAKRFGIDKDVCEQHWRMLLNMEVEYKVRELYKLQRFDKKTDPEQMLYDGFINDQDKQRMRELREANEADLTSTRFVFEDSRLNSILLSYKARHYPNALSAEERSEWQELKHARLIDGQPGILSIAEFRESIALLKQKNASESANERGEQNNHKPNKQSRALAILQQLEAYANEIESELNGE